MFAGPRHVRADDFRMNFCENSFLIVDAKVCLVRHLGNL
jgi:hypothetical protein